MIDLGAQLRTYFDTVDPPFELEEIVEQAAPSSGYARPESEVALRLRHRWATALSAAVATIVVIGGVALLIQQVSLPEGPESTPVMSVVDPAPTTTDAPAAPVVPMTATLDSHLEPALLQLGDGIGFSQSNGTLWAWDEEGGVAGYRDGVWRALPSLPDPARDVAGTLNGPVWAITDRNLWHLEDGEWRTLPEEAALTIRSGDLGIDLGRVEVDEVTGSVWVLVGADLYRWDGLEMMQVQAAPEATILDDFVVAGDGTIWAGRSNFYLPWDDRLARFDEATSAWLPVRPLGGTEDLPASIAITPSGNLWVGLSDSEARAVLAYLDTTTGEWATYWLPVEGFDVVADDEVVWFQSSSDLYRFDGENLAVFSPGGWLDNIGLGNDGTLWVTIRYERDGVYQLVIDEEPTE